MLRMSLLSIEGEAAFLSCWKWAGCLPFIHSRAPDQEMEKRREGVFEAGPIVSGIFVLILSLSLSPSLECSAAPPPGPGSIVPSPHCSILQTIPSSL